MTTTINGTSVDVLNRPTAAVETSDNDAPPQSGWLTQVIDARSRAKHTRSLNRLERKKTKAANRRTERIEKRKLKAEIRDLDREEREKRAAQWRQRRERITGWYKTALPAFYVWLLKWVPTIAPMSVAWVGQIAFARDTLGWDHPAAQIVFAAAWETTTLGAAYMYDRARRGGDKATKFRLATWLFAGSAGAMNYWHASPVHEVTVLVDHEYVVQEQVELWPPSDKAVAFGAMSVSGILMWELRNALEHREVLRAKGLIPAARPAFGIIRWVRFPLTTFTAWSMSVRLTVETVNESWRVALAVDKATRELLKSDGSVEVIWWIPFTWLRPVLSWLDRRRRAIEQIEDLIWEKREARERLEQRLRESEVTDDDAGQVTSQVTDEVTPQVTQVTGQANGQVTPRVTPRVTRQVTSQVTGQATRQVTSGPAPAAITAGGNNRSQVTSQAGRQVTRRNTNGNGRRTRTTEELEAAIAKLIKEAENNPELHGEIYGSDGVLKVAPVARRLNAGRDTVRPIIDGLKLRDTGPLSKVS